VKTQFNIGCIQNDEDMPVNPNDSKLALESLLSNCRQMMAMAASGTCNKELIMAANERVSAAKATLHAASLGRPPIPVVTRKLSSKKKLEKQLSFRSLRAKRRPVQKAVSTPNASQVAAAAKLE